MMNISDTEKKALNRTPITIEGLEYSWNRRPDIWRDVSREEWSSYGWQMAHLVRSASELEKITHVSEPERKTIGLVSGTFPMMISPHYAAMFRRELGLECPLRRQAVPDARELDPHPDLMNDPLGELRHSRTECCTVRYPDRALLYTTNTCAMRCRHCTRRGRVGLDAGVRRDMIFLAIKSIINDKNIRDVLISGGDAFALSDMLLDDILHALRTCDHIDTIRIGTRMPCTLPQRAMDCGLLKVLERHAPLYVNTQFNHPFEASLDAEDAMRALRGVGCILGNQSVLLRGINDDAGVLEPLYRWLLRNGCRPYYLFLCDVAQGTNHFRTPIGSGLDIMRFLRGRLSGLGIPHFVIDLPDGNGKVDLCPDRVISRKDDEIIFSNWFGEGVRYRDVGVGGESVDPVVTGEHPHRDVGVGGE